MSTSGRFRDRVKRFLDVGSNVAFKVWRLSRVLQAIAVAFGAVVVGALVWAGTTLPPVIDLPAVRPHSVWSVVASAVFVLLVVRVFGPTIGSALRWRQMLYRIGAGIGMCLIGWLLAAIHLAVFDPIYLRLGGAKRFREETERDRAEPV